MSARDHLERVRSLRCVVCRTMNVIQSTPTAAHHPESIRDELSHYAAIALCWDHHQGPNGVHGLSRRGFEMRYKLTDIDLIALTVRALDREDVIA
jgi:hypothetical protein